MPGEPRRYPPCLTNSMKHIRCPKCDTAISCDGLAAGSKIKCSGCSKTFVLQSKTHRQQKGIESEPIIVNTSKKTKTRGNKREKWGTALRNRLIRHKNWCGTRSFVFQTMLASWTLFILALYFLNVVASFSIIGERKDYFERYTSKDAANSIIFGMLCFFAFYLLFAFPLATAAIATLESNKSKTQ